MAISTKAGSVTAGLGASVSRVVFGPFPSGSLLDGVTVYGQRTDDLTGPATVRVGMCDVPPGTAGELDTGDLVVRDLAVASPGSFWSLPLFLYARILRKRYVVVEFAVNVAAGTFTAGANVGVRPPIIQREKSRDQAKEYV